MYNKVFYYEGDVTRSGGLHSPVSVTWEGATPTLRLSSIAPHLGTLPAQLCINAISEHSSSPLSHLTPQQPLYIMVFS